MEEQNKTDGPDGFAGETSIVIEREPLRAESQDLDETLEEIENDILGI